MVYLKKKKKPKETHQTNQLAVYFVVHINDLYTVEAADKDNFSSVNILPLKHSSPCLYSKQVLC